MSIAPRVAQSVALLAATLLVACGGGGGGDAPPATPVPPPASGFQISGQVRVAANTLVDSDVNDSQVTPVGNDSFATAQPLPSPATLAGYVNEAGAGPEGRSRAAGDEVDLFRIDGVAGQTVSLIVGDPDASDIDLYLLDANQNDVDESVGTGRLETVTIPATGRYYVGVRVYSGAGTYVLALGQAAPAASSSGTLLLSHEFVPGEVIVRWRERGTSAQAVHGARRSTAQVLSAHALTRTAGREGGDWLVRLDGSSRAVIQSPGKARPQRATPAAMSTRELKSATLQAVKKLRADPEVLHAEPNYIRRASAVPADTYYGLQWHYPLINLPAAWDVTTGANSVIVAVVDTGVLLGHPDLQGQLLPGFDFISDAGNARDGNGIDNNPNDNGDRAMPGGASSFHGTHVAGTVAASSNTTRGVAGVAWNARIMPLRVLGERGGSSYDIAQAVLYAAGLPNDSGTVPARRADIINLSLGGGGFSQAEQNVYNQARAAGAIVVAAAGNESTSTRSYPAAYDGVISVSAVSIHKTLASYSNYGDRVDVAAPGGDSGDANGDGYVDRVLSTAGDDSSGQVEYGYSFENGTSMAAPHVAGVLALMKSVNPQLTPADIDTLLAAGRLSVDIGAPGRDDNYGHGLIDALKAVQAAQGTTGPTPALLTAAPGALNFTPGVNTLTLEVGNGGSEALQVTAVQVTPASAWLTVTPPAGSATGLGAYTVTVNRGTLAPGSYTASIRLQSNANTVTVPVVLQVTATGAAVSPNLGRQYILLADADTMEARYQVEVNVSNGVYNFQFNGVAAGDYVLVTGSDPDNDGAICGTGEACGAYVSLDQPAVLSVSANRANLNFSAGYMTSIGASAANVSLTGTPVRATSPRKRLSFAPGAAR